MKTTSIAEDVRRRLIESKATQQAIAEGSGVGQATVSRFMRGEGTANLETVESLLAWLNKRRRTRRRAAKPAAAAQEQTAAA